ncbi:MAG: hypothetical protein RI900_2542, partial [Actinomycetota bacterium]
MNATLADRPSKPSRRSGTQRVPRSEVPPLTPGRQLARAVLLIVLAASAGLVLHLAVVSRL